MALVELTQCDSRFEADLLHARLSADGIMSFVFDAEMSWIGGALRARVMVDDEDLARARRVLGEEAG